MPDLVQSYHVVTMALLAVVLVNVIVGVLAMPRLRVGGREGEKGADGGAWPKVSVLVPARNEEGTVGECARSLVAQRYPDFEVIVLDDRSEDGTARVLDEVAEEAARAGVRFRVIGGEPLPEGWVGKPWACHQLAAAAVAERLLFVDADTVHGPEMLMAAVATSDRWGVGLLSAWPFQRTGSWSEHLVIPLLYWAGFGFAPHLLFRLAARRPQVWRRLPWRVVQILGGANGQFLFFERATYDAVGGHAAVRDHLVEDIALGRRALLHARDGGKGMLNVDGMAYSTCRMYRSFPELWEGFSKNVRPFFEDRPSAFVAVGVAHLVLFVVPFAGLGWALASGAPAGSVAPWAWAVGLVLAGRVILTLRFRTSWWSVLFHPVAYLVGTAIALNSWRLSRKGAVTWKGRRYAPLARKDSR